MARFLFWNLYGQQRRNAARRAEFLCRALRNLVTSQEIDVLLFAECKIPPEQLGRALNGTGPETYHRLDTRSRRIESWTRLPQKFFHERLNESRLSISELTIPGNLPVLFVAAHLKDPSRLTKEADRGSEATAVANSIRKQESLSGHNRTFVIGDLNMNPFETGMLDFRGLHSVMTRRLTEAVSKYKIREEFTCFYNPMWSLLGDNSPGPAGSYYFADAESATNPFWHMYDQLLIRPELLNTFRTVEILNGDGRISFLTKSGRPRKHSLSDHLPLLFEFEFQEVKS